MNWNTPLLYKLQMDDFLVSVQLDPPTGTSIAETQDIAEKLFDAGVRLVDINSSRRLSWDSMHLASLVQKMGLRTIPHITSRDATPDGLLKQALAAYSQGVSAFLAITGDQYDPTKSASKTRGVFHGDAIDIIKYFRQHLRENKNINALFAMGAAVNQNSRYPVAEGERVRAKTQAGADFFMSQPVFSLDEAINLQRFYKKHTDRPLLIGIWPQVNMKTVENLRRGAIGGVVLREHIARAAEENADSVSLRLWGLTNAYNLIRWIYKNKLARGVYIVAPSRDPLQIIDLAAEAVNLRK
jgi:homocysteine S-methyltransferase